MLNSRFPRLIRKLQSRAIDNLHASCVDCGTLLSMQGQITLLHNVTVRQSLSATTDTLVRKVLLLEFLSCTLMKSNLMLRLPGSTMHTDLIADVTHILTWMLRGRHLFFWQRNRRQFHNVIGAWRSFCWLLDQRCAFDSTCCSIWKVKAQTLSFVNLWP